MSELDFRIGEVGVFLVERSNFLVRLILLFNLFWCCHDGCSN